MFRLIVILGVFVGTFGSLNVLEQCINTYTSDASNDYMKGTWHRVYKFTMFGSTLPSRDCQNITLTVPTTEELKIYKDKYDNAGYPFTLDENSLYSEWNKDSYQYLSSLSGLYTSEAEAKFWVLDPKSAFHLPSGYNVEVFQKIDQNYVMYWDCSLRGSTRWLLSRKKDAPLEEMLAIIEATPELKRLVAQRNCAL